MSVFGGIIFSLVAGCITSKVIGENGRVWLLCL